MNNPSENIENNTESKGGSKLSEEKIMELRKSNIPGGAPEEISDYLFIQEKIKGRPVDKRKLLKKMVQTAGVAMIFGMIACITFILIEPVLGKMLRRESDNQQALTEIVLPEPNEIPDELPDVDIDTSSGEKLNLVETPIEDMIVDEGSDTSVSVDIVEVPVVQEYEIELSDYRLIYRKLYALSKEIQKSMVTLTDINAETQLINTGLVEKMSGLIIGDNGVELLILVCDDKQICQETMVVTFSNSEVLQAELWAKDNDTGITIYAIDLSEIPDYTMETVEYATMGSSYEAVLLGMPVIAVGQPMGNVNSLCQGVVTSVAGTVSMTDSSYQILTTDILSTGGGSGFLANTNGQIVGVLTSYDTGCGADGTLVAYGFSGIKKLIENLSVKKQRVYAGLHVTDVTAEVYTYAGVPKGAYVTKVDSDSPSMNVGITAGDVIIQIGDKTISSVADYMTALNSITPDTEVSVIYARQSGGGYIETEVEITFTEL